MCADPAWLASQTGFDSQYNPQGGSLSKGLFEAFKTLAETTLDRLENGYEVKAILWHQGENDWRDGDKYYGNIKTLVKYFREQIYNITGNESARTVPFIAGTVARGNSMYSSTVEAALWQLADEDPNFYVIDCGNFALKTIDSDGMNDGLHFSSPSVEAIGKLLYDKLVELRLVESDIVTGIDELRTDIVTMPKGCYDITGRKIASPNALAPNTLYIKDGKKYVKL